MKKRDLAHDRHLKNRRLRDRRSDVAGAVVRDMCDPSVLLADDDEWEEFHGEMKAAAPLDDGLVDDSDSNSD